MKLLFSAFIAALVLQTGCVQHMHSSGDQVSKIAEDSSDLRRSGIDTIIINKQRLLNLTTLGEIWGLLKYHHPKVAKGEYDFDAELFHILPSVINSASNTELSKTLERWVDQFGKPAVCTNCAGNTTTSQPDYGIIFDTHILSSSLVTKLKYIVGNANNERNYYISMTPNGNPVFTNELPYSFLNYPDAGYRLLCLFRYWNMIHYFFPYKHLIGTDWINILPEYIPRFIKASNETDYVLTTLSMIGTIHDSHASIWSVNPALENYRGRYLFPFQARFIENNLTITAYYNNALSVRDSFKIGDVITSIDGHSIKELIEKYLPITPGSNYSDQLRDLPVNYLLRSNKMAIPLEILRDGIKIRVTVFIEGNKINTAINYGAYPNSPGYKLINKEIGYIYPGNYKNKDLDTIKKLFSSTKGIIVDMRCYPSEFMPFTFVPYIKSGNAPFVKFTMGSFKKPGVFKTRPSFFHSGKNEYRGKVIVIVNELTQSQAEYTTMAFQSSPNVTVIGSTTAGADGDVSPIILPGGIRTMISGIGVLYPDGTETQRTGVKINYKINPTLKGIKAGRDELLEKAIQMIEVN